MRTRRCFPTTPRSRRCAQVSAGATRRLWPVTRKKGEEPPTPMSPLPPLERQRASRSAWVAAARAPRLRGLQAETGATRKTDTSKRTMRPLISWRSQTSKKKNASRISPRWLLRLLAIRRERCKVSSSWTKTSSSLSQARRLTASTCISSPAPCAPNEQFTKKTSPGTSTRCSTTSRRRSRKISTRKKSSSVSGPKTRSTSLPKTTIKLRKNSFSFDKVLSSLLPSLSSLLVHLKLVLDAVHAHRLLALLVVVGPVVAQVHVLERRLAASRDHLVAALRVPRVRLDPAALEAHKGHELARVRARHGARELLDVAHHRELRRLVGARPLEREVHLAPAAGHVHRLLVRHEHGLALLVAARLLDVQAPAVQRGRLQRLDVLQVRLDVQHEQHHRGVPHIRLIRRARYPNTEMEAGANTAGDASPRAQQQSGGGFARQGSGIDERIRSASSGSFAGAHDGGEEDDDASMSNDESMSSSSSLEMDDAAGLEMRQQQLEREGARASSFDDFARQLPYQIDSNNNVSVPPRATSFSFDVVDASLSGQQATTQSMWLLTQFAPAMSKTMRSADPSADMEDDEPFDEDTERNQAAQANAEAASQGGEQAGNRAMNMGNRRVAWASSTAHVELPEGVRLTAARNEVTGVQLRLKSNVPFLLTTDTSNWMLPLGHGPRARVAVDTRFVPPHMLKVEAFVVGCVEDENSDLVMETLERTGVSAKAAREHGVYLRVRVGENLEPGVYELPLRVFTQDAGFRDEQLTWSSSFAVRVLDVRLPAPSNWHFRLDLWQHWTAVARAHRVALWGNRHFELIDRYMAPLSEMGQKCLSVVATEMPWAGQQCYMEEQNPSALFEHAILEVYEDSAHGVPLTIDFTHFDRLLELAGRHHLDHEIEVFGLLSIWRDPVAGFNAPAELTAHHLRPPPTASAPDPAPPTEVRRRTSSSGSGLASPTAGSSSVNGGGNSNGLGLSQDQPNASSSPPPSPPTANSQTPAFVIDGWRIRCQDRTTQRVRYLRRVSEVESFIEQFYAHCVALEIADRVRICADEPRDVAVFHEQLRFMQRLAPNFRIKLAVNHSEFFSPAYAPPQVADYVPLLPLACADLEVTRRLANDARARGGHVCWYVCCGPAFPNQFVSSPLVEGELVGYLTFFFELDGFLRWNYCLWPSRPWDDLRWRAPMWKVGDMYFVLPGRDGWPVETLRLESLRFAGQAFELLALAQEKLAPAQMQQLQRTVAEQILRSSDLEEFGRCGDRAREDLYSLDPLDYQRAKTIILETLAAAAVKGNAT